VFYKLVEEFSNIVVSYSVSEYKRYVANKYPKKFYFLEFIIKEVITWRR